VQVARARLCMAVFFNIQIQGADVVGTNFFKRRVIALSDVAAIQTVLLLTL